MVFIIDEVVIVLVIVENFIHFPVREVSLEVVLGIVEVDLQDFVNKIKEIEVESIEKLIAQKLDKIFFVLKD